MPALSGRGHSSLGAAPGVLGGEKMSNHYEKKRKRCGNPNPHKTGEPLETYEKQRVYHLQKTRSKGKLAQFILMAGAKGV